MSHLSPYPGTGLAIEVEGGSGGIENGGPVGRSIFICPNIAQEVKHGTGLFQSGRAEGQSANGPGLLLELRGHASIDGMVAGVMRAGGDLIDQQPACLGDEKFHGQDANIIKGLGHPHRYLACFLQNIFGQPGRHDGDIKDVVAVDIFRRVISDHITGHSTGNQNGNFGIQFHPFFKDGTLGIKGLPNLREIFSGGIPGNLLLALAIISKFGGFQNAVPTDLFHPFY